MVLKNKQVGYLSFNCGYYQATVYQLAVALVSMLIIRIGFYLYHQDEIGEVRLFWCLSLLKGAFRFDAWAVAYFNSLFIVIRFLPFKFVARSGWIRATNLLYGICNGVMLLLSVVDVELFSFFGSHMRWETVCESFKDPNILGILLSYVLTYWWMSVVLVVVVGGALWLAFRPNIVTGIVAHRCKCVTAIERTLMFLTAVFVTFICMRGHLGPGKPLSIGDAAWYAVRPSHINICLNAPFTLLRSVSGGYTLQRIKYFTDSELLSHRNSIHTIEGEDSITGILEGKNLMIITLESGAQMWLDSMTIITQSPQHGLMPFLDSIASRSLVCRNVMATGVTSVGGATAVYGGFPAFDPMLFMVSPYNSNEIDAPARLLKKIGYSSVFYFGGNPGSFSIDQLVKAMGFDRVVTRVEYGNDDDFDGTWGIFDHSMGKYAANDLSAVNQPFIAGWFTLAAHGPFVVPDNWNCDNYKSPRQSTERSIEYTDRALRHFFDMARKEPWYQNTAFVITGDHGCRDFHGSEYDSPYVKYHVPLIMYTPDGSLAPGEISGVMSQFDIAPTLMRLMGYKRRFVSLGNDVMGGVVKRNYAISKVGERFMITGDRYVLFTDLHAKSIDEVYDITTDWFLRLPVVNYDSAVIADMMAWTRAFLQDYTSRLIENQMSAEE